MFVLRDKFARATALAAALVVLSGTAAQSAPTKHKRSASAVKKKSAAVLEREARNRAAAELKAAEAAAAAQAARVRARWGSLADLAEQDFAPDGRLVTVRWEDDGNTIALTEWGPLVRQTHRVKRDAATGALTYDFPGQWSRSQISARIAANGVVEAVTKDEVSWPLVKRDEAGDILVRFSKSRPMRMTAIDPFGKVATRLAKLIEEGKVSEAGSKSAGTARVAGAEAGSTTATSRNDTALLSTAAVQAVESLQMFRDMEGHWSNGSYLWSLAPVQSGMAIDITPQGAKGWTRQVRMDHERLEYNGAQVIPMQSGVFVKDFNFLLQRSGDEFTIIGGRLKDGRFQPSATQGPDLGSFRRLDSAELAKWQAASEDMRLAEIRRKQQSKGSNGMLGGLLAGFGAAMAGGNAEMVMGAAMKGVEMTTDNEMSRNVLGGKGDAMVRDGFERRVQEQRTSNAVTAASRSSNAASSGAGESSRGAAVTEASAASEKASRVTTNAILLVGIRPTEKNTRNPMCYSTPFRVTYDSSPNKWGDSGRAEAAAMAYRGQFEAACSRHGVIDGMIQPIVEGIQPGYSAHKVSGEDFVVRVP